MTNYQKIFDDLIAGPDPVRMKQGGGIGSTLREDRGSRMTGRGGRGSVATQFRSTRPARPTGGGGSEDEPRTLAAGSDPNQTTMVPLRSSRTPTPLSLEQLKNLRRRTGAKRFPGGIRPARNMQLDKIREIQAKGLKFGNYADDKELFERMLENSGFAQRLGAKASGLFKDDGQRSVRRFVYDPEAEKILAFESEAPGVGLAGFLMQAFGGSGIQNKPMVFTGDERLNFITNQKPTFDENENPPFNPCPPGFVLKDGVCTPLVAEEKKDPVTGIPGFEMGSRSVF